VTVAAVAGVVCAGLALAPAWAGALLGYVGTISVAALALDADL
jgi:hypothetical protein